MIGESLDLQFRITQFNSKLSLELKYTVYSLFI